MALNMGAFEALDSLEMFSVDGGDKARQEMVAANRARGTSVSGSSTNAGAYQAIVTGTLVCIAGIALALPTGGASLALGVGIAASGAGAAVAGLNSL